MFNAIAFEEKVCGVGPEAPEGRRSLNGFLQGQENKRAQEGRWAQMQVGD